MLPSACPKNHAANLLPLPDGSLMCVWFGGTGGYCGYLCVGFALSPGKPAVGEAEKLSDDAHALRTEPGSVRHR